MDRLIWNGPRGRRPPWRRGAARRALARALSRDAYLRLWRLHRAVRGLVYRGRRLECPCCGGTFRRFLDYGGGHLPLRDIVCPGCGAFERHRLVWLYLRDRTELLTKPCRLLHVAPEVGLLLAFRRMPALRTIAVDLRARAADVRADVAALAFADRSFDAILCSHVLEHVADDRAAIRELCRVLRPGGFAVLQSPVERGRPHTLEDPSVATPEERARLYGQHDHLRLYGADYPERLAQGGFDVEVIPYARELPPQRIARMRLNPHEELYVGRRLR